MGLLGEPEGEDRAVVEQLGGPPPGRPVLALPDRPEAEDRDLPRVPVDEPVEGGDLVEGADAARVPPLAGIAPRLARRRQEGREHPLALLEVEEVGVPDPLVVVLLQHLLAARLEEVDRREHEAARCRVEVEPLVGARVEEDAIRDRLAGVLGGRLELIDARHCHRTLWGFGSVRPVSGPLAGKTILMSGGSRGIGLAIALRAARDGANVALVAKTDEPDPRLPGTIHTAAAEIEAAGGTALPIVGDVRSDEAVEGAVAKTAERFGGIDVVVNNASAIAIQGIADLPVKRYDLMLDINARGTFLLSKLALPHLLEAANPHVLTLSPPVDLDPRWLGGHAPYTLSKYGMTILTLGLAAEQGPRGLGANCLWPRTIIATAAVQNLLGGDEAMARSRRPEIVADAAHAIMARSAAECTGNCFIDDQVLAEEGVADLSVYRYGDAAEEDLQPDLFL